MEKVKYESDGCDYFVFELDAEGNYTNETKALEDIRSELSSCSKRYTDVVIIAHGYNTKRNRDGSLLHANSIVPALEIRKPSDRNCLYIGITWPSFFTTVLDGEKEPPKQSKELVTKVLRMVRGTVRAETSEIPATQNSSRIQAAIGKMREEAEKIVDGASFDGGGDKFYPELWDVIADFADELEKDDEPATDSEPENTTSESGSIQSVFRNLMKGFQKMLGTGRSRYGRDDDRRSSEMLYKSTLRMKKLGKLPKGLFEVFYGTFETRAHLVGARGVHKLVADIMKTTTSDLRIHLFGHSLGAIIVLAAAVGEDNVSSLPRKLHSILLMQGACPGNVVAKEGPYRNAVTDLEPVAGPILATVAFDDLALKATNIFRPVSIGRVGFEGTEPYKTEDIHVERMKPGTRKSVASLRKRHCYNLISDEVISDHNEVDVKEIMDIFWNSATIEMEESDYKI